MHNKITIINYGVVEDVAHTCQSIRNIILTKSHETAINPSQIADCLRIVIQALNFLSSQLAVTIWNPHQRSNTNTIKLNIESTQLIVFLITDSNVFFLSEPSVPATPLIPTAFSELIQNLYPVSADTNPKLPTRSPSPIIKAAIFCFIFCLL